MTVNKKKFKISSKLILNLVVLAISLYLITYFFISENGLIDLLLTPNSFNPWWILVAFLVFEFNTIIDSFVTLIFVRSKYKHFTFIDALKVAFVGVFFSAITPSNTGGQPMQLYLMSQKNINLGFGSACMTQKFIVYQILSTAFSVFAVITHFDLFKSAFTGTFSTIFVIIGFLVQLLMTALFLVISFCKRLTNSILKLLDKLFHKLKFIKEPDKKIERLYKEVEMFHSGNKALFTNPKIIISTYLLVIIQIIAIMSVPYLIYISFGMPEIAIANGQTPLSFYDSICIQSFVLFTSNLVPLPGASGGAELAFTLYFSSFFVVGSINKIKPAILLWRFVAYYLSLIISSPFSYFTKGKKSDDISEVQK